MSTLEIFLTVLSITSSVCAIYFGYMAFKRNKTIDNKKVVNEDKNQAINIASIQIDLKYTRETIARIDQKLDNFEKNQNGVNERLARFEERLDRVDHRLDKLEKKYS